MRLLHREESRPKIFVIERTQVLQLSCKLSEILMPQSVLSTDSLVMVVNQKLYKNVLQVLSAARRQKLLHSDALLRRKVYLHVGGLTSKSLQYLLLRSTQDIMNSMNLIELVLARKQRLFSYEFKKDTTESPNIHFFVIVAVSHEAFGSPVPTSRDIVSVRGRMVFSLARA